MKKIALKTAILIGIGLAIKIFSLFPAAVERYYSHGIYPIISQAQRILLGWIPFSIGDILYALAVIFLVRATVKFSWKLARKRIVRRDIFSAVRSIFIISLVTYIWFNISWGLNYNRPPLSERMNLSVDELKKDDLIDLMEALTVKVNELYPLAIDRRRNLENHSVLFEGAIHSYIQLEQYDPGFRYRFSAIKPSMFSYPGNYMGFTGYYNPFTGEAQVNTQVPEFIRPFTTCHEIGHQLGYAKESEANFAGFLAAQASDDPAFRYSAYFDMYSYARSYLYRQDSLLLKQLDARLLPGVRNDFRTLREFSLRHANPVEVLIDRWYAQYLKANQQPSGKISYNEVILLLMAWYRQNGTLELEIRN